MGDGGGRVGRVRQLVGWQGGHASGWESSRQKVVEGSQLVSSCLLAPAGATVTEPDLKGEKMLSLAPCGELRVGWGGLPADQCLLPRSRAYVAKVDINPVIFLPPWPSSEVTGVYQPIYVVLGIEPRALCMLGKRSTH